MLWVLDEHILAFLPVRKDPRSVEGGAMSGFSMAHKELLKFVTPEEGAGGSKGIPVHNIFPFPKFFLLLITPTKSKFYSFEDGKGAKLRLAIAHFPHLQLADQRSRDMEDESDS